MNAYEGWLRDTLPLLKEDFLGVHSELAACQGKDAEHFQGKLLGAYYVLSTVIQQMVSFQLDPKEHGFDIKLDDYL